MPAVEALGCGRDSPAHCFVLLNAVRGRKKQMLTSSQQFIPIQWRLSGSHVSILELRSPINGARSHSVNERTAGTPPHGAARPMVDCSLTRFKTAVCSCNAHTAQDHTGSQSKSISLPVFIAALRVTSRIEPFFPSKHSTRKHSRQANRRSVFVEIMLTEPPIR